MNCATLCFFYILNHILILSVMLAVNFIFEVYFNRVRKFPSIPSFLSFYHEQVLRFVKWFFWIDWNDLFFFLFSLLVQWSYFDNVISPFVYIAVFSFAKHLYIYIYEAYWFVSLFTCNGFVWFDFQGNVSFIK